jgi:hypothetical protein
MATAAVCSVAFTLLSKSGAYGGNPLFTFPFSVALTVCISLPTWISVTFLTRPVSRSHLERFFTRVRPGGAGWRTIYRALPHYTPRHTALGTFGRIATGIVTLNAVLIGIGMFALGDRKAGAVFVIIAMCAGAAFVALLGGGFTGESAASTFTDSHSEEVT